MNILIKLALCCVLTAILSMTVKKQSPEIALLIAIATLIGCATVVLSILQDIKSNLASRMNEITVPLEFFIPMIKCCAVSVVTQISCNICKDAGQASLASGLDFAGNLACVLCLFPLIEALFGLIGGLL